jgi:hypothetical protein
MKNGGERECLMEERENKVTGLRGVKLVMCIAHDQDTCHILNGEFRARAATWVAAKLCPKWNYELKYWIPKAKIA